jgi:hypothetical protein
MQPYFEELLKVGNRGYTTGFYLGEGYPQDGYSYDISKGLAGADFLCEICGCLTPYECEGSEPNTCAMCMPLANNDKENKHGYNQRY